MRKKHSGLNVGLKAAILLFAAFFIASCGAPSRSDSVSATPIAGPIAGGSTVPAKISFLTDKSSVKSDNSDFATLTATVYDANNSPVEGTNVTFTTTGGSISTTTVATDATGTAVTQFSSGTIDKSNQTVTITAVVIGVDPKQIPIQITGSTVTVSATTTSITSDGTQKATLTATVKDAANANVFNAPVTFTVSGAGSVTLSPASGNTNASGQLSVTVTGASPGDVIVTATSLGATATQSFTITTVAGAFGIVVPATDPASLETTGSLTVTVNAPTSANVVFATTIGVWDSSTNVVTKAVSSGTVSATLTSTVTGMANIMVYDAANPTLTDSLKVAISAPTASASALALQSNVNVLPPSVGGASYTATLTATVTTASNQVVGNAPVAFSIMNPTGGGETISPVVVYTDSSGIATATFTSGSLPSSQQGVNVKAAIIGSAISDTIPIVIGGTPGSIVIGRSTEIKEDANKTYYILPMSVLVSDTNGNPVSGQSVTLSLWPVQYITDGSMDDVIGVFQNEDVNENVTCDGCDTAAPYVAMGEDLNGNGELTPPNSAAGDIPGVVTTADNGVANFNLTYLKASSRFIVARMRASVLVQGTETTSSLVFTLPATKADIDAETLPPSPYTAPVVGVPFTISLSGAAGGTVSQSLAPTFGSGTYTFSAAVGAMTPTSGASSSYSYTIPGGVLSGTVITDTISITDSSVPPAQVTINVTITVL